MLNLEVLCSRQQLGASSQHCRRRAHLPTTAHTRHFTQVGRNTFKLLPLSPSPTFTPCFVTYQTVAAGKRRAFSSSRPCYSFQSYTAGVQVHTPLTLHPSLDRQATERCERRRRRPRSSEEVTVHGGRRRRRRIITSVFGKGLVSRELFSMKTHRLSNVTERVPLDADEDSPPPQPKPPLPPRPHQELTLTPTPPRPTFSAFLTVF